MALNLGFFGSHYVSLFQLNAKINLARGQSYKNPAPIPRVDTHEQSSWYFITQASLDLKLGKYNFKNVGKPFPLHSPTCKHVVRCPAGFE
jgi:hypothetical protein